MRGSDLRDEVTATTKANELLMQAMVDNRFYLLVEGATDFRLFNQILPTENWEVEFLDGKQNVVQCMAVLSDQGIDRATAILDSDPLDPSSSEGHIFYSELADLDADLLAIDGMIDRIIAANAQVRDQRVLLGMGLSSWRDVVMGLVEPWTAARKHFSEHLVAGVSMKDFPIHLLGDAKTVRLQLTALKKLLADKSGLQPLPNELVDALAEPRRPELEPFHNGHHMAAAVAWILSNVLSSTKMNANTVEDFARTAITPAEIRNLLVISELTDWAHSRGNCVWRENLCECGHR